jgi:YHS domain-containing protein
MRLPSVALALVAGLVIMGATFAAETTEKKPEVKPQTVCPVTGEAINKDLFADYEGKRVYFCCADCIKEFNKEPAKYVKKMEAEGITLDKTPVSQTTCPVMGGKINKSIYADYEGKRVYFCCAGCPATFKKDPAKYVKKLEDAGVTLDKTPAPEGK